MKKPDIRFISLFVNDITETTRMYTALFGPPESSITEHTDIIKEHPFAVPVPPVIFKLGSIKLVIYQANGQVTHPGDVGIGLVIDDQTDELLQKVNENKGQVFFGPRLLWKQNRRLAIFVLPDRHFFELLS